MFYYKYKGQTLRAFHEINDIRLEKITEQEWKALQPEKQPIIDNTKLVEMNEIKMWLNEHDYIINKHTLGEYQDDDERWLNYLQERQVKLARYNELEALD